MLEGLRRDVRLAVRVLRRSRGFTFVAVSSLAVGFALVASTTGVVNAYLIRSLPFAAAHRLYHVMYAPPGPWEPRGMTAIGWTSVADVVEYPITSAGETFYLTDGNYAQSVRGLRVTRSFVEGLGVRAGLGRSLDPQDFGPGTDPVGILGYALWRDRYGSDPGIIGRIVRADAEARRGPPETFRVVGVLPPDFYFGRDSRDRVDLLVPLAAPARTYMVRLRDGVPPAVAERRITEAARLVATDLPADWTGVHLESARERYVAQLRPVLVGITLASILVLVIVCANVAVLTLLRTLRRQKEMAVRAALGSSRWHLARMLVIEALLICLAAFGLGTVLTRVTLRMLGPLIETQLGRPAPGGTAAIAIDGTVMLVAAAIGLLVALLLSFMPLLAPWQRRLGDALRRARNTSTDGLSMRRLRLSLIAFEVAGTLILLVGGGVMIRTVVSMVRTDLRFEPEGLIRARIVLRGTGNADPQAFFQFYDRFAERLTAATNAPVVFTNWPPFAELPKHSVEVDGRVGQGLSAGALGAGAGYFGTLGIELRGGRDFSDADVRSDAPVAVVSETLARTLWPDGAALGRQVRSVVPTPAGPRPGPWRTVIGVASDVRQTYSEPDASAIYTPLSPSSFGRFGSFYVRTDRSPASLLESMRAIAAGIDPRAMVDPPRSVAGENRQMIGARFLTGLLTAFAAVAVFLAILGIYGVTAYAVQQREREVAIRLALGATGAAIRRLFLRDCGLVLAIGIGAGLLGAVLATRVLESALQAVRGFDVSTLVFACVLLSLAGTLAAWWPARRASRQDPVGALKEG
ncbi:MAG TPA: ABC transporter permease [Vicinamibacterales bacterium]|nr:ABC transporter permease [Vicinamibacterales bacterium]